MSTTVVDPVTRLGTVVRETRKARKLTQAELAYRACVSRVFVIELEAGHPRAELGKALAVLGALGVSPFTDAAHSPSTAPVTSEPAQGS